MTGFSSRPSCKPDRMQTLGQREQEPKDSSDHVHGAVPASCSVPHPCRGNGSHSLAFPSRARTEAPGVGPLIVVPCDSPYVPDTTRSPGLGSHPAEGPPSFRLSHRTRVPEQEVTAWVWGGRFCTPPP